LTVEDGHPCRRELVGPGDLHAIAKRAGSSGQFFADGALRIAVRATHGRLLGCDADRRAALPAREKR
jgi:hypothetical protein